MQSENRAATTARLVCTLALLTLALAITSLLRMQVRANDGLQSRLAVPGDRAPRAGSLCETITVKRREEPQ